MIVVFPNYAARFDVDSIALELGHALLFDALTSALPDVAVAASVDVSNQEQPYSRVTNVRVRLIHLGEVGRATRTAGKLLNYFRMQPKIMSAVQHADFCYVFLPGHVGLLAGLWCALLRRPYGVYLRGDWRVVTPRSLQWIPPLMLRRAKFVLCTGSKLADEMAHVNASCETVIPMSAVLLQDISPRTSFASSGVCRILFVGQVTYDKGVFELVDAIEMAARRGAENLALSVVGTGPARVALEQHVKERGLADRVRFYGVIADPSQLAEMYAQHDIFCLPTYYPEGFPRALYEAMTFSLPSITTRVGQIESVIRDDENALFVKIRDADDLAAKIVRLANNRELRERLGRRARTTMEPLLGKWRESTHGHQVLRWMQASGVAPCAE